MLYGYARISKHDGSQKLYLQKEALKQAGVQEAQIYSEEVSAKTAVRAELKNCLRALRKGDILFVWQLDRLGRNVQDLIHIVEDLNKRGIYLKVLSGQGAFIDTSSAHGKMLFNIFAALAEYERELIIERTKAGLAAARARGRLGGRPRKMTEKKIKLIQTLLQDKQNSVTEIAKIARISRSTIYHYFSLER